MAGDRGYAPKEDRLVRDELSKLGEKIRNWARRHSVSSLADLEGVSGDRKDLIVEELRGYTVQADWDTLIGKMTFSPSKIPTLLLQALVVKDVFERMFGDAFFAFTKFRGESNVLDSEEMRRAHNMMAQINEADAHIWRSQTLQNLSKSVGSESKSVVQQRIDSVCSQLVSDFVDNPARELLRPARDGGSARRKELEALYNGAAQLASSLWTQRTFMVCQSQQGLPVFNVANPAMSAHRLHQLDEDDQKLDGNKVMLFVQPAILAFGTENAEDYDRGKVWAPAIVVVDEK
ncbi:hypothetical protein BDW59DRAFT_171226 [Aspergillus cavernicola]|uniref:Uncharacterized protein n=1 Tax=Aspergillus cavernicola TaxID=176166 RepID=A0ABR4IJ47_9EURO